MSDAQRRTLVVQVVRAPRLMVYRALIDADAVQQWMVPEGMTSKVHAFEPHVGGAFRISLTYDAPGQQGKSSERTDTHHGRFVELVPGERVVQAMAFETTDPGMQGVMTTTFTLREAEGGTEVVGVHDGVPPGVKLADNQKGWEMALGKLAKLVKKAGA